ncbi:MAG TPA: hypothetical protein VMY41_17400, partial [Thermohalobaculum sp.]|nr:hypothetical protein [Thermohalobaculum sp.]
PEGGRLCSNVISKCFSLLICGIIVDPQHRAGGKGNKREIIEQKLDLAISAGRHAVADEHLRVGDEGRSLIHPPRDAGRAGLRPNFADAIR